MIRRDEALEEVSSSEDPSEAQEHGQEQASDYYFSLLFPMPVVPQAQINEEQKDEVEAA